MSKVWNAITKKWEEETEYTKKLSRESIKTNKSSNNKKNKGAVAPFNYFDDGYQFGDVTKSVVQTGKKVGNFVDEEIVDPIKNFNKSYKLGKLNEELGFESYKKMMGEANNYDKVKKKYDDFVASNSDFINDSNLLDQSFQSLPNQIGALESGIKSGGIGAVIGAGVGGAIGSLGGAGGTAAGAVTGAKALGGTGYVTGSAEYSYKLESGLQYQALIELGVPEEIALKEAKDTGLINAFIESGESILDLVTLGGVSALKGTLTKGLVKKYGQKTVASWVGENIVKNAVSEGVEEGLQETTSVLSEKRAMEKAGLERDDSQDKQRIIQSAISGGFSGGLMGGATGLTSGITKVGVNTIAEKQNAINGGIQPTLTLENMQQNVPYTVKSNKNNINPLGNNNTLNTPVLSENKQYAPYVPIKGKETENKKSSLVDQVEKQGEDIMKQEMQNYESITNDFKDYLIEEELDINEITDDNIDDFITNMYGDYEAYDNYNTEENVKGIGLNQKDYNKAKEIIQSYINENKTRKEEVEKNDYELWQDELNEILEKAKSVDENFYNDMKQQSDEYRDRHRLEYRIYEETQSRQAGNEVNDDFFKEHFSDYDGQSGTKLADGIMTSVKLKKGNNLAKLSFTEGEDVIWIDELYVKNKNQGYGTEIVETIKKYANENGKYVKAHKELSTAKGFWDKTLRSDKNNKNDIRHNEEYENPETTNNPANNVMTMSEVKSMIDRVFNANGIYDFYDGKYSNADEWIKGEGIDDVSFYVENTEAIYDKFLSKLDGLYEDYTIEDILQAYVDGTLKTEKKAYQPKRLDLSKEQEIKDNRFYAPRVATNDDKLYSKALERVTNTNRQEVYKARADFIINAHEIGYLDKVGVTAKQFIEKSKSWANYNKKAMDLSNSLNEGVASQNKWTGIENSSIVNTLSITDEQLNKMIKEIKGESQDYQRKYIVSTMLALDTHIDYKNLTFEFNKSKEINQNTESGKRILGLYDNTIDTIKIGDGYQNTVAHEMGHYLDRQWGRELFGQNIELSEKRIISSKLDSLNPEQRQFVENFKGFIDDLENNSDIRNNYTMSSNEVFARFVARFVEWTKNQATNNRYGYENKYYEDNFTERQYKEFVKLLQEKSYLDTTGQTNIKVDFSKEATIKNAISNLKGEKRFYIENVGKFNQKEYNTINQLMLPKKEYGKLAHTIDSVVDIEPGINNIILTDKTYEIYYKGYNDFKVLDVYDTIDFGEGDKDGINKNANNINKRIEGTKSQSNDNQFNNVKTKNKRTTRKNDGLFGVNTRKNSEQKYSNIESIGNKKQELDNSSFFVEEIKTDNKGYHWGDLGKGRDTYHWNMTSSRRSTGHFGTGTYFLGSKDGNIGSTKNGRQLHEVDFSKYNLFKPENENEAYTLHEGLKALNYINNFNSDDFESLQLMLEKHGITGQKSYEAFVKARELYFSDEYQNASYDSELDSISTYFMKELGFNGIDVRGIEKYDNGSYGSVIYNLDNTVTKSDGSFTKFIDKSLDNKNVAVDSLSNPIELGTMKSLKGEKLKLSSQEYNSGYGFIRKITAEKENGEKAILSFKKIGTNTENFDYKNNEYIKDYHTYEIKHLEGAEEGDTTGTTLLNELIKEAKENGISKIVAYDTTHTLRNRPSKTYWEKQGFKSNGEGDHVLYLDDNTSEYSRDIRYSIEENDSLINAPKQDNKGRKLTKEQQEFYKNEDKKILDENGNIKTLYHGTPYNNFTTFKGKLFCFSEDYKFAKEYGETKSFDQGLDADVEVKEVYVKAENIFDPSNPEHIKKLSDNLSDNINYWGNIWDKETLLNKLQRKDTLPPKWKPEQIENKKFGDYIGDDRYGYNTDMFVGVNNNNEIVYISQDRDLQKLSQEEKDMYQKQLMDGKEVIYTTYQTMFGDLTEKGIHNKINELQKQSEEYKKENGFENESIDYYIKKLKENLEWIKKDIFPSDNHKLIPRVATQESTELTDIDNWTYFETAMDNETRKDIVEIIQELGFDGINMYEDGVSNFAVFKPNQIKNVDNLNPSDSDDIRYSMVEDPIEISKLKKEDASTTPVAPFVKTEGGKEDGRSKHYSNLTRKSKFLNDKSVAAISNENGVKYYDTTTNQETLEKAKKELDNGGKSETLKWFNKDPKNAEPTDIAKGWILLKQYQDKGDYDSVVQVAKKMRMMGTTTGKTLQMYAIMERLTPEGMVNYAQSELSEAYELMIKNKSKAWIDKHKSDFDLSPSEVKFIMDTMQEVSKMQEGYEKDVKLAEIQKLMTDKLPPEKGAGIKAWMRISMLFNPKTQVRNVLGNAVIAPVNAVGDVFASGIDKMIAKKTGVRTTGNVNLSSYNEGFKKGLYKSYNDFKKGINTRNIEGNRFEIGQGKSFNDKTLIGHKLNQIDNLLSFMLDAGDRGFYEATFNNSINNQLILNNTTKVTPEMIDIATTEALQRTWQDNNEYTKFVLNTRKGLNKLMSIGGYGLGDILIPFAKTPANLTKAIIDYSPVGLVHSLVEGHNLKNAIETGQFTAQQQHKFVQDLGKAVAGTMLYVIGYALAKADIISGENDEDKDTANFMKNTLGISPYSIKIGNKSFTYDWAQPVAAPFAIMSDFMSSNDEDASILEKSISAFNTGFNIVVEQSFMQSIKTVLDNKDGIATGIQEAIMELPSRAIPTLSKQIVDLTDGTQRQTFVYGKPLETAKNKVLAKIPGASKALAPTVDTMGREIKKYGGKNNIFNVFFNPASVNNENISESAGEIYRLYQETGRTDLMPRVSPYYINHKGEKIVLSNEDKSRFQKISGDIIEQNIQKIMNSSQYQYLSDEEKADIIQDIVNYSYNKARFDVLGIEMSDTYQSVADYEDMGGSLSDYYLFQSSINNENSEIKKQSISNFLIESDLSDKEISYLYNKYYSSDETMNLLSKFNIPVKEYIKFNLQSFESDYNNKGRAISGSKQAKVFNYINSLKLSTTQKAILMKMQYKSFKKYDRQILNYINKMNATRFEKASYAKQIGFDYYDDYLINYILKQNASNEEKIKQLKALGFKYINGKIYK